MTKIQLRKHKCHKCGTEHDVMIVFSYSSFLGKPDFEKINENNKCPNCGSYYAEDLKEEKEISKDSE